MIRDPKPEEIRQPKTFGHQLIKRGILLQDVGINVLLDEAVEENGQRGEADVVESQVGGVIERLFRTKKAPLRFCSF